MEITYHDGAVVELSFDKKLHAYRVEGKPVHSATKVLSVISKPALIPWSLKMGSDWLEKHMFHDEELDQDPRGVFTYTSRMTLDALIKDDNDAKNSIEAFELWVGENDIDFISSEEKVYSREDHYAGTLDCAAYVNGSLCIIDWKTSKAIYPEYHLQNAAYAKAWEDIHGKPVEQTLVLRLDKSTGRYEQGYQSTVEWNKNYEAFICALNLYNRLKELR